MTRGLAALLFGLIATGVALPLSAADRPEETGPPRSFAVTSAEIVDFLPGGMIAINASFGHLTVEGWDEPKVQVTVTKSTRSFYPPSREKKAERGFDQVRVVTERRSDKELAISTLLPVRHGFPFSVLPASFVVTMPKASHRGVTLEYTVHVPRDSRLVVHHDYGYVWVSDVKGDIEVDSHTGDMIVMLPDPGPYSIDAKTGMGSISSDLMGRGNKELLVGSHFVHAGQAASRKIVLRMGRGCIAIKNGPPSGPFWKD
jgi:hypothetical protein